VVAKVIDMFCNFHLVKNHKIADNSTTTEAREKVRKDLEYLEFYKFADVGFTKFKNNHILLIKLATNF
jgi:hypothetical protein